MEGKASSIDNLPFPSTLLILLLLLVVVLILPTTSYLLPTTSSDRPTADTDRPTDRPTDWTHRPTDRLAHRKLQKPLKKQWFLPSGEKSFFFKGHFCLISKSLLNIFGEMAGLFQNHFWCYIGIIWGSFYGHFRVISTALSVHLEFTFDSFRSHYSDKQVSK